MDNAQPHLFLYKPLLLAVAPLIIAMGMAGCAGLPDQRLANEALKNGDTATAQANYKALADMGYADASVGLADIQLESGDPAQLAAAEDTYRQAADTSPRAASRLGRLLATKPNATEAEHQEAEKRLKQAFANGEEGAVLPLAMLYLQYPQTFPNVNAQEKISQWREQGHPQAELAQVLLYRTQGTYDAHLADVEKICKAALSTADVCYVELATVYQKRGEADKQKALVEQLRGAYGRGVVPAARMEGVAQVLADPELVAGPQGGESGGKTDPATAQQMLEQIAPTYPAAWVSLAQLLYDYPEQGDIDKMLEYLKKGREAAQPRAELLLGKLYYEGKLLPADPVKAEQHLLKAAQSETSANYYLGQMYRRGYLGQVQPQQALDHLLAAARAGQNSADFALAQMFSQGRGIAPDPVNAYVFSQIAVQKGTPQAPDLAAQIEQQLPPGSRPQAERLLREEQALRGATLQTVTQMQAMQSQDGQEPL
ncbi:alginate biosynthesis TPR repeat lipoprotein AlgK [Pseudomonas sp. GV071]|uniref:alginate biosynthesis TPR repeat lipoprotein AlgK n=1 Tax=Pseudomonas sp. GV071 TaxID=2135754 RepID=UPI000D3CEF06|nr:alginate biosynthesis TPR repeat lipoprotein AlgK [Pseudomonas sp. GV071]PTQ71751.1 alginate biosynthesis protein AlgK [Pseudomonas sp. GV071]